MKFFLGNKSNTLLILLVFVVLGAGGFLVYRANESDVEVAKPNEVQEVVKTPAEEEADPVIEEEPKAVDMKNEAAMVSENMLSTQDLTRDEVIALIINGETTISGTLGDVTGGTSKGTAYTLRKDGMLYHYVSANLPDLIDTHAYEGWLVVNKPLQFFSTGTMEKANDGSYSLVYIAADEYEGFDHVVVTEETEIDAIPEKHIIEGTL